MLDLKEALRLKTQYYQCIEQRNMLHGIQISFKKSEEQQYDRHDLQ